MQLTDVSIPSKVDAYFDAVIDSMPDMVWVKDASGTFLTCNPLVEQFFGVPRSQIIGRTDYDFVASVLADDFRAMDVMAMAADTPQVNQEWLTFASDGRSRLFETKKTPMRDAEGTVIGILGIARDITEHHNAKIVQEGLNRALKLIGKCNHAMMHATDERSLLFQICELAVDVGGYKIAWAAFAELDERKSVSIGAWSRNGGDFLKKIELSWDETEIGNGLIGTAIRGGATVVNRDYRENPAMRPWRAVAEEHGYRSSIAVPLARDGEPYGALVICAAEPDAFNAQEQSLLEEMAADLAFGLQRLSERVEHDAAKRQLEFLAHHDALTGTPNRVLLSEHFTNAVRRSHVRATSIAVLLLDIDNFKVVNDSLGHDYGDRLLIEVTKRLQRRIKNLGVVCRYGGDEFAVLLHPVCEMTLLNDFVRKLIDSFTSPMVIGDYSVDVTLSAGVSLYPKHANNLDDLIKYADIALQKSKTSGKNTYRCFDDSMQSDELRLGRLRTQLRSAIRNNELLLQYQPKVNLGSGEVVGVEALVRWQHPEQGLLPPGAFIPLAERTGLIVLIGDWVINEACRQFASWLAEGLKLTSICINVSALQVRRGNLLMSVSNALRRWGLPPRYVELELTESIFLSDAEAVIILLKDLRRLGVKLSIDDFGTGYSSLAYLKTLRVDRLKIDQSFVRDMTLNSDTAAIVKTIVQLGRNLNLAITAEGVEERAQLDALKQLGCDEVQGYLISKPLEAATLSAFCTDWEMPKSRA
jgi:diguanylate cyclase (GGDEF)-like protein/PAS domain S-box-containing protein